VVIFIDDILIYSKTRDDHAPHIHIVLQKLWEHHLYAKFSKCVFWLEKVYFLGHILSKDGVAVDPSKVQDVLNGNNLEMSPISGVFLDLRDTTTGS
jgi:hypothetical protein